MSAIKYGTKRKMGRISERLQFAFRKYREAEGRLKDLVKLGRSILETAEYSEAKMEVLYWQKRISELRKMVGKDLRFKERNKIGLGSTVMVRFGSLQKEYTIVTSLEADPARGYISNESPLGRALLNKAQSESVSVKTPSGDFVYSIVGVA